MLMLPADLRLWQAQHTDHYGRALVVDGDVGPRTRWSLAVESLCPYRRAVVRCACAQHGLLESPVGSNSDPDGKIRGWLEACGTGPEQFWCAAYASAALDQPGKRTDFRRCAGAVKLGLSFPTTADPIAGDVMWYPTGGGKGHIGIVIGSRPRFASTMTIEGNLGNGVRLALRSARGAKYGSTCQCGACVGAERPDVLERGLAPRAISGVGTR
jgi:hypothetical protein